MANLKKMMQQAASMQKDMERIQEELALKTVEFSSGGGMVTAVARGDGSLADVRIDAKVVDPEDVEMLQDLVLASVNGALAEAKEEASREMAKVTAGLGLPGL
ncbi:MAG: YbaB/EbfC family nucleoid-associated protein [Verrucomicrobia bacterium]|nr:YbaB/EbfC family nucleoid-associated protein [Verrucomicrobiota bacterium]MDA1087606.1 YbaB/EbfC family nucleoid-associated protein [Verrucomicrobiota bacterium]